MIPQDLAKYFWDTDIKTIDPKRHKTYIIERILELGDEKAIFWLNSTFSKKDLEKVINSSRQLSPKSINFWRLVLSRS